MNARATNGGHGVHGAHRPHRAEGESRLHRGGSNAGAKVIHKRIPRLLSTMAAGSEYDKEQEKEATKTRIV